MPRMAERLAGTFVGPDNMVGTPEEQRRISVYEFPSHNPPHIVIRSRANSMALPPRSVSPTSRKYTLVDTGSGVLELESEKNDLFDIIQEANMDGVRHLKADDALSRLTYITGARILNRRARASNGTLKSLSGKPRNVFEEMYVAERNELSPK
ncbi:hypothetical protein ANCCEY_02838 [Ancylostoma ceylanicum]|uniref:Uncharacterized protein n=1 Tax=Ancylostoma ceylanicum TaxID=53326 RepID=A0A0D6M1A7_9BILA|nr:hypothetical protein ANCCEY_02838 [Ancylostoma ceylanicum]